MSKDIHIRAVRKSFPSRHAVTLALESIDLTVPAGEFITLVGASGCGKSTLLRLIAGLDEPDGGSITVDHAEIDGPGADRAMVFQNYSLFPWLTVLDNILYSSRLAANKRKRPAGGNVMERAETLIGLMGLEAARRSYPSQLSGGMQQRVAIARALMSRPEILLMDEPFGALDAQTREIMQELILNVFQHERTTIVFVTHDVDEAIYLGERVVVMAPRPGRIHSIHAVPFTGGRVPAWRMEPEFLGLKREILACIRQTAGIGLDPTTFAKLRGQAAQNLS